MTTTTAGTTTITIMIMFMLLIMMTVAMMLFHRNKITTISYNDILLHINCLVYFTHMNQTISILFFFIMNYMDYFLSSLMEVVPNQPHDTIMKAVICIRYTSFTGSCDPLIILWLLLVVVVLIKEVIGNITRKLR